MIHPVYGETDYRNIERSQLNPNIPLGRGMIKWAPFATMPEQYADIKKQLEQQHKVERPVLCDDRLEELNRTLQEALHRHCPLLIEFYHDGYIKQLQLTVEKIDHWAMLIIGVNLDNQQLCFVSFIDVINLSLQL
ncbi:YolD-like family protein [Macrococcus equipercicus]|uniref:YolD-like family protein n=1 Tax=Macrococcus equipercicus TaxID=69967 RepID=A0A9Q9F1K4_9STAP|nr:YolD-like family protein [Macrococcus equipercicus]KAA1037737.1 YolD-like family protein [Macrococcus equipercicus]UTH13451.1 YolD-like family protein [Macrococcus equipercicus]